ncbi:MAG: V-type ATP synthase subunit E [Nitrosopumilaceae archaeon]|uniref:V-type ATP synthase subunit E n=2 Tax=Candidatus Nitrosomaritimum aestuariumsis TaxID=3342354 RepID=A0AC60W7T7_9ARCH|nr:V-type ATP synthase subunit E [Nitrosopumilaceae archaeon]MBA4459829.1 V-type ATP synthase subunit E [Nitrosopumilaceae archaeon]MBA4461276.1 V-type ATP synthase subunit E [Nitrosopumilaceae archaeon]MBA4463207.1 V-type ATP synthase subunit E [Nitrosopumilaceae archaeon]
MLAPDSALERTIDKILSQTESNILSGLNEALAESQQKLDDFSKNLEQEYDQIINDGKKEADKIEKQIMGSADLEARNKQLTTIEESIDKVFQKALDEIANADRSGDYSNLIKSLLDESTKILGTTEIVVFTNTKDKEIVQSMLSQYPGSELSSETIECLGGVKVKSKDGSMTFDNTVDARIERLKPLIRKDIATQFGVGN